MESGQTPFDNPFVILIDSAEQQPWTFKGLKCDANRHYRPLAVKTEWKSLGRHPHGMGDYSIQGYEGLCHVERKSLQDCQGTILGWPKTVDGEQIAGIGRRKRFEQELRNLEHIRCSAVIVEATCDRVFQHVGSHGKKSRETNAKILFRSILAYQQDYRVPWYFCDGRELAEIVCFRLMERFCRHYTQEVKENVR